MRVELAYHGDGIMENLADIFRVFRVAGLEVVSTGLGNACNIE